jgi:hypothetical protein
MNVRAMSKHIPILLVFTWFISGCHEDNTKGSSGVATGEIYLDAHFTANGTDAFVAVQLLEGDSASNTQVELEGGDVLWASLDESIATDSIRGNLFDGLGEFAAKHYKLIKSEEGGFEFDFLFFNLTSKGDILYTAALPYDSGITVYYLSFLRPNGMDAPSSTVSIPENFELTAPQANEIHIRVNVLQVNWEPFGSSDQVALTALVNCVNGGSKTMSLTELADTGSILLAGGVLNGTGIFGDCATTLEITKSRLGTLDPRVGSGRLVGHQVRRVSFITSD